MQKYYNIVRLKINGFENGVIEKVEKVQKSLFKNKKLGGKSHEKLVYVYSYGKEVEHTKFISDKTMLKESNGADRVTIYKCNEYELEQRQDGYEAGEHITAKLLK